VSYLSWDMGLGVLSEVDSDGFVGIQVDAYGEEDSGVETYEAHLPLGLYARPLDPEKDPNGEALPAGSATVLYAHEGGRGHAFPMGDPRAIRKLPKLRKGGAVFYAPASGGYVLWDGKDPNGVQREGSLVIGVPYGSKAHTIQCGVREDGKEYVRIQHGEGNSVELLPDGSTLVKSKGGSYVHVTDDQIVVNGDAHVQGALSCGDAAKAEAVALLAPLVEYLTVLETALKAAVPPIVIPPPQSIITKAAKLGTKTFRAS
jgi:hypothetical protein